MADKKQDFVVSDRRRFGTEGELRSDVTTNEEENAEKAEPVSPAAPPPAQETPASQARETVAANPQPSEPAGMEEEEMPEPPSAAEVQDQKNAYHASGKKIEEIIGKAGGRATMPEMTFERLVESFYMTALLQLGAI